MTQALVSRPGSEALNDNPIDYDPNLLNFTAVESWIVGFRLAVGIEPHHIVVGVVGQEAQQTTG
jgi:hypothetical protein